MSLNQHTIFDEKPQLFQIAALQQYIATDVFLTLSSMKEWKTQVLYFVKRLKAWVSE